MTTVGVPFAFRRRLMARFASLLFLSSGAIGILTLPLRPPDVNVPATIVVATIALLMGAFALVAPWHRWPRAATLVLVPPAFALIAAGNVFAGSAVHAYGVFFVVAFVWIGVAHPRWTSVWFGPLAVVAYLVPLLYLPGSFWLGVGTGILTVGVSVVVGELLARGAEVLEKAEAALRDERQRFLSLTSHELRTPITIARGHLDMLKRAPSPSMVETTVEVVEDELTRMNRIITDLTAIARMEDPGYLHLEPTDLDDVINTVAAKARPLLGNRLRVVEAPRPAEASVDAQRITQALLNLLSNAARHETSSDDPVELRVRKEPQWWRLEVANHGGGLPPGEEEALFEPLRTGPSTAAGEGLGLAIVRAISKAHGGSASVDNRPGKGATFWIRLPRAR
jgi:signal transduction histidine kinase